MDEVTTIGIDLAKSVFHLIGLNAKGAEVWRRRVYRDQFEKTVATLPRCELAMEACAGAHEWGRRFERMGFTARLVSPAEVAKRVGRGRKNDWKDTLGVISVARDPMIKAIAIKSASEQAAQVEVRVRDRRIGDRTALINQMRGLLGEYGVVLPKGAGAFKRRWRELRLEPTAKLAGVPDEVIRLLDELDQELVSIERLIAASDKRVSELATTMSAAPRLMTIPGIGPINSVAFAAGVPEPELFVRARSLSAWLGIVPKQHSTGGKTRLGKIRKHGDPVLRTLLCHAARAVLRSATRNKAVPKDALHAYARRAAARLPWNKAVIAVANKLARIIWCVLVRNEVYRPVAVKSAATAG